MTTLLRRHRRSDERGQTLVEFALALPIFLFIIMGVFDFGRAIYQYNGVSQAARELARVTSVHRCGGSPCTLGSSSETAAVLATQQGLIPGLQAPVYTCVDIDGSATGSAVNCLPGDQVRVDVSSPWTPITPILGFLGTFTLRASSTVSIQ